MAKKISAKPSALLNSIAAMQEVYRGNKLPENIIAIRELAERLKEIEEDVSYALGKAKAPKVKRQQAHALKFWSSLRYYIVQMNLAVDAANTSRKECKCINVEMGSYSNQTIKILPWKKHQDIPHERKLVGIDNCILEEIEYLWNKGVETVESCCGHNKVLGYIAVTNASIPLMFQLGYSPEAFLSDINVFRPKSTTHISSDIGKYNFNKTLVIPEGAEIKFHESKPVKTMAKIYIASSWRHQHAVEMLTDLLREQGHEVRSFIENDYGENPNSADNEDTNKIPFEQWIKSEQGAKAFAYDTEGALSSDLVIYIGGSGKDAAAECGMAWANKIPIIGLFQKGEDFGLMRRMMWHWVYRFTDVLHLVDEYFLPSAEHEPDMMVENKDEFAERMAGYQKLK